MLKNEIEIKYLQEDIKLFFLLKGIIYEKR